MGEGVGEYAGNLEIHKDYLVISVNPKIYALDVVHSAAYTLIDRAYIVVTGDPDKEILVEIRPTVKADLLRIGRMFNNELLNYAVYKSQIEKNNEIRTEIVKKALSAGAEKKQAEKTLLDEEEDFGASEDDPEGIRKPWVQEKE
ncbi:MAG: hypothetical protein ABH879_03750 [archaeon]